MVKISDAKQNEKKFEIFDFFFLEKKFNEEAVKRFLVLKKWKEFWIFLDSDTQILNTVICS